MTATLEDHRGHDIMVWWPIDYGHSSRWDEHGCLMIDTSSGKSGESGPNDYWCRDCDQQVDLGSVHIDYE